MRALLVVVEAAATQDLTTVAAVKAELGITDSTADALLADLIRQASEAVARYCNRVFGLERVREVFRLDQPRGALILARTPLVTIHSVNEDGTDLDLVADIEADTAAGLLYRLASDHRHPWCARKVTVEYTGGYALHSGAPHDLERAAVTLAKTYFHARQRDPALRTENIEGVLSNAYATGAGISGDVARILDQFRHPVIC